MWRRWLATPHDVIATLLRIVLGGVMFPHGAQKALGWFGGGGISGTIAGFSAHMHISPPWTLLAIAAEFLGSLGLIVGLLGRVAAFGIGVVMLVAATTVHAHNGFFMNWTGQAAGEGIEYHLLALTVAIAVMVRGSGAWSLDRALAERGGPRP